MRKLFLFAVIGMSSMAFAQNSYFSLSAGYGLGFPGNQGAEADFDPGFNGTTRTKIVNLGGGLNINASYGLPLSQNLHFDIGLGYQNNLGSSLKSTMFNQNIGPGGITFEEVTSTDSYNTWGVRLTPSLRFQGDCERFVPFAQVGPQLNLASMTISSEEKSQTSSLLIEEKYSARLSVGAFAALGVETEIADNIMLFATLSANVGYYSPAKSEIITYQEDGQDVLPQLTTREKETEYVKEVKDNGNPPNPDEPNESLRVRADYSALGFNLGVRIIL